MSPTRSIGRTTPVESRAPNRNAKITMCARPTPANPALLMPMPTAATMASNQWIGDSGGICAPASMRLRRHLPGANRVERMDQHDEVQRQAVADRDQHPNLEAGHELRAN